MQRLPGSAPETMQIAPMDNAVTTENELRAHPAVCAWNQIADSNSFPRRISALNRSGRGKAQVYRLAGIGPSGEDICAKRSNFKNLEIERAIYQDVLPQLPLTAVTCYGLCRDKDPRRGWLFVEDAGDKKYESGTREQKIAFTEWLAHLHGLAARLPAGRFADRGPKHYFKALQLAREQLKHSISNPALGPDDVAVLGDLLEQGGAIERRWDEVETFCSTLAGTLVHGDLMPKNVRVRPGASGIAILVLDWEMAGWAVPAADLERADLAVYGSVVNALGMRIAHRDIEMLAVYGKLFRLIASVEWDSQWLKTKVVEQSMFNLRVYREQLGRLLDGEGWR